MVQVKQLLARAGSVLLLAAAAACSDGQPVTSRSADDARAPSFSARARSPRDVPEVKIDLPPQARAWDNNPAALAQAVAAGDGFAVVAFKEPGSARALATGRRAAVTAGTVKAGVELLERSGAQVLELLDAIGGARVRIAPQAAAELAAHPLVDFVEPRQYGQVQAQSVPAGVALVQAHDFWTATGYTGAGVKIEIIDTGHEQGHPDLPAIPSTNCSGLFGGCNDNATVNWHGTHVLGIITARNNGDGVVGAAPGIGAGDIYMYGACDSAGRCPTDEVTSGISAGIWNVQLMNLSLVQPFDLGQSTAVGQAWGNGIVMVAAAGNNMTSTVVYPAGYANVVGVSGVKPDKSFASSTSASVCGTYSNQGSHVDLAAPIEAYSTVGGGSYNTQCGTSMAAAHVTGVVALLKSQNPSWTNQQVVDALFARAEDLGPAGKDVQFGHGLVMPVKPTQPEVIVGGPNAINTAGTYGWNAYASGGNGAYAYRWEYRVRGTAAWTVVGSGSSYVRSIGAGDPSFDLRVVVTSAGLTASDAHLVDVSVVTPPTVSISGTGAVNTAGTHTWQANASGGNGSYTYSWEYRPVGGAWSQVGTASTYSRSLAAGHPSFELRVTVTSAGLTGTPATHAVAVNLTPPVSVYIDGPTYVEGGTSNFWSAIASGGTGSYTYEWQISFDGSSWNTVGTSQWYSRTEPNYGLSYYLRVIASSGGMSASYDIWVDVVQSPYNDCNNTDPFQPTAKQICPYEYTVQ